MSYGVYRPPPRKTSSTRLGYPGPTFIPTKTPAAAAVPSLIQAARQYIANHWLRT